MSEVAPARLSSTVVLLRDASDAPELYLVQRHAAAAFGGAYVFPGGVVDNTDCNVHDYCLGLTAAEADRLLAVDGCGLDHYIAAIRELFEETGVLLAHKQTDAAELEAVRDALNASSLDWCQFVIDGNVKLCCDELHYFSHWITPVGLSKRFTTRFFVSRMPESAIARHDDGELTDALWITAADALRRAANNELLLHFPTIKTLEQLAAHASIDSIIAWADRRASDGVAAIRPVLPKDRRNATPEIPDGSRSLR